MTCSLSEERCYEIAIPVSLKDKKNTSFTNFTRINGSVSMNLRVYKNKKNKVGLGLMMLKKNIRS